MLIEITQATIPVRSIVAVTKPCAIHGVRTEIVDGQERYYRTTDDHYYKLLLVSGLEYEVLESEYPRALMIERLLKYSY